MVKGKPFLTLCNSQQWGCICHKRTRNEWGVQTRKERIWRIGAGPTPNATDVAYLPLIATIWSPHEFSHSMPKNRQKPHKWRARNMSDIIWLKTICNFNNVQQTAVPAFTYIREITFLIGVSGWGSHDPCVS